MNPSLPPNYILSDKIDKKEVSRLTSELTRNKYIGSYFTCNLSIKSLIELSNKIKRPILYLYPNNSAQIALEIKTPRTVKDKISEKEIEEMVTKALGMSTRNLYLDGIGDSMSILQVLFNRASSFQERYPILINKSIFGMSVSNGEQTARFGGEKATEPEDYRVFISNRHEVKTLKELDEGLNEGKFLEKIDVYSNATLVKNSKLSFTKGKIYYKGYDSMMVPRAAHITAYLMQNYNNDNAPVYTKSLQNILEHNGSIAAEPNEVYTAITEANRALSNLVEKRNLKFIKSLGHSKGYVFDTNGF